MTLDYEVRARLGKFSYAASIAAAEEIVVLFGHSGAGKSVTLQFIAGLLKPAEGRIVIGGNLAFDSGRRINLSPQERQVGYVPQELALFRHLSVINNIRFGAGSGLEADRRVSALIRSLRLEGMEDRSPSELSGGQQQRVALARALARDVKLLLLDEPFSALDESLRAQFRKELIRLRSDLGLTILFVTHDLREAHLVGDRIAVFDEGTVLQFGVREDVFRRPTSRRVAELTGVANIWRGKVLGPRDSGGCLVEVDGLKLACDSVGTSRPVREGDSVDVLIRAERVNLRRVAASSGLNMFTAVVNEEDAFGSTHLLTFAPVGAGPSVKVEIAARPYEVLDVNEQKRWTVELPPADLHVVSPG